MVKLKLEESHGDGLEGLQITPSKFYCSRRSKDQKNCGTHINRTKEDLAETGVKIFWML